MKMLFHICGRSKWATGPSHGKPQSSNIKQPKQIFSVGNGERHGRSDILCLGQQKRNHVNC